MKTAAKSKIAAAVLGNLEVSVRIKQDGARPVKRIVVQISGQDVPDCPGLLEGFDAGMLFVRLERQIPEKAHIVVWLDQVQLSGIVAGCQPSKNDWQISIALLSCKRQLSEMIPRGLEAAMGVVEGDQSGLRPCTVLNSSPYGLGLRLAFPVRMGAHVCIAFESMVILGEMRHCHAKPDGSYIAGLVIVDVVTDARNESAFSVMLNNLRWKLASTLRGKEVPAYREDR